MGHWCFNVNGRRGGEAWKIRVERERKKSAIPTSKKIMVPLRKSNQQGQIVYESSGPFNVLFSNI